MMDAAYCKIFRTTLTKQALSWFNNSWLGLLMDGPPTGSFMHQFSINRKCPKTIAYLFQIKQKEEEPLRSYMKRFVEGVNEVANVQHETLSEILQQNLYHKMFTESIAGRIPASLEELLDRAEKHIRVEEGLESRPKVKDERREKPSPKRNSKNESGRQEIKHKYIPLNAPLVEVMYAAQRQGIIEPPRKMRENPKQVQSDQYCHFHRNKGHATEKYFQSRGKSRN
ncbi:hypothetical protein DH2020_026620 [Rehmannia glutinosa]|uniref:Retrotransposon gag domain-containing protein n=1 Tax=Rehmannia glutinosa TaxID=99300 RepID=A0ABR0VZ87_REHGL